jgi:hypothetical protein
MNIEERLWDYIDGLSSKEEKAQIEVLIESNLEWKKAYAELLDAHQLMQNHIELDQPSMRFTQNVMEEISRLHIAPATKNYINKNIIWGVAGFFIFMIIATVGYGLSQISWGTGSETQLPSQLSKVDFTKVYNNTYTNIFIMVNTVLGLALLDMYLRNKSKKHQEKHM